MPHRYSTALSHLILAGTGIYCLRFTNLEKADFPQASFGIITVNSLIGVWRWGNPDYGDNVDRLYKFTSILQALFALPCITTTIWLKYGYQWEFAYAHTAVALLPLMTYLLDRLEEDLFNVIETFNFMSLGIVSWIERNYFGVAAAISFAFNYCVFRKEDDMDIPALDLYNYGMCFFAFFSLRALGD